MNFKNTYINVVGLSIPELEALAAKYSEAAGCVQEEYLSRLDCDWPVMRCNGRTVFVAFSHNKELETEITEQDLDNYLQQKENAMSYPTFDFKIDLSNMSDAEKEVAKEWLVDVAESLSKKVALASTEQRLAIIKDYKYVQSISLNYDQHPLPELFLTFSKPTITSWETPFKKSEKELQLEELVGKLQQQLKEAEQQLENLK